MFFAPSMEAFRTCHKFSSNVTALRYSFHGLVFLLLSEYDIHDDLCAYVGVEASSEFAALHVELLAQNGGGELHVECLIADAEVFGVAGYHGSHHMFPSLNEAILVERGFEALLAEKLSEEITHDFGVGTSHVVELKVER